MFSATGVLRPQWQRFAADLNALGPAELSRRWDAAKRLIHENGVTYNLYADPTSRDRPWELDPVPLLLDTAEWNSLSASLAQCARLLNHILVDLYGAQRLLHEGLIPPEFVFAHQGFLRACHNLHLPQETYLHVYAAHLVRCRRWLAGAGRSHAGTQRRGLRAGKPDRRLADAAAHLP